MATTTYFSEKEIEVINKFGLDADLLEKLLEPDTIIVYDSDVNWDIEIDDDDEFVEIKGTETEDFGISIDTETEDLEIWISGYDEKISENERLIDDLKYMCKEVKCGGNPREVWHDYTFKLSL
jgi:hypothetical protein